MEITNLVKLQNMKSFFEKICEDSEHLQRAKIKKTISQTALLSFERSQEDAILLFSIGFTATVYSNYCHQNPRSRNSGQRVLFEEDVCGYQGTEWLCQSVQATQGKRRKTFGLEALPTDRHGGSTTGVRVSSWNCPKTLSFQPGSVDNCYCCKLLLDGHSCSFYKCTKI